MAANLKLELLLTEWIRSYIVFALITLLKNIKRKSIINLTACIIFVIISNLNSELEFQYLIKN